MAVWEWMVGGMGAAAGGMTAVVYGLTVQAQRPRPVPNETTPSVPYEDVDWQCCGKTVKGWFLPPAGPASGHSPPHPVIVVAHGWNSNRSRVLRYAHPLHEDGYAILMYDARNHGDSDAHRTPYGWQFRDDLLSAIAWLQARPDIDPARIGVIGHSLGAYGAVLSLERGAPIAALVTDSMPVRFKAMVGAELRRRRWPQFPLAQLLPLALQWQSGFTAATMRQADPAAILRSNAERRGTPVMLVHSRKDAFVPPEELHLVLSSSPGLPHLFVEAEGHSASDSDPSFWPEVKGFFREQMGIQKK